MTRLKLAALLMLIHGFFMEFCILLILIPITLDVFSLETAGGYFSFDLPYLQDNLDQMMVMAGIFGIVRIIGAIGVLRNRLWGLYLAIVNCIVTMVLMIFMLPAGIADGVLATAALVLLLQGYYKQRTII